MESIDFDSKFGVAYGKRILIDRDTFRAAFHFIFDIDFSEYVFVSNTFLHNRGLRPLRPRITIFGRVSAQIIGPRVCYDQMVRPWRESDGMRVAQSRVANDCYRLRPISEFTADARTLENTYRVIAMIGDREPSSAP